MDPEKLNIPGKIKKQISKNMTISYKITIKRKNAIFRRWHWKYWREKSRIEEDLSKKENSKERNDEGNEEKER
jgi:hypothetical protein